MIRRHILLVGMMLSGKSTVGPPLADHLSLPFVDLDETIESRSQRPISSWFEERGEAAFREAEFAMLSDLLAADTPSVIAAGGGAFEREASRIVARERAWVVYLHADAKALAGRIGEDDSRPLLRGAKPAADVLAELLAKREPNYRQAHEVVSVDGASVDELVHTIAGAVARREAEDGWP